MSVSDELRELANKKQETDEHICPDEILEILARECPACKEMRREQHPGHLLYYERLSEQIKAAGL